MTAAPSLVVRQTRRDQRERQAAGAVPTALPLLGAPERELLARWARSDSLRRTRQALVQLAGPTEIERAEALCECLLHAGWLVRRERLVGGRWQWESIIWRDLDALKALLGLRSARQREADRETMLAEAGQALEDWRDPPAARAIDPDFIDEMTQAIERLRSDALRLDLLRDRLALLQALRRWHDEGRQGLRRDFALWARDATKAIGRAEWAWLEAGFDLERLGIASFAPLLWLAGDLSLRWSERRVDAGALHCLGLPLADVMRAQMAVGSAAPRRYWLIENRASFERQAQARPSGVLLLWLPGRPSAPWLNAVGHLIVQAPAPAWISADADPAGVDIACAVGRLWAAQGQAWVPHQMGLPEWQGTMQRWPLNSHDHALLDRLLGAADLPMGLRELCEAMQQEGRKAEQEGWL